jgi:hypothetical protein
VTAQAKTPEAWQGNGGNETAPTLTKETIQLKITRTTETAAQTMPTPKVRAYLDARPAWVDEPFSWLFQAGFSMEEFAYFIGLVKVQHSAAQVSL